MTTRWEHLRNSFSMAVAEEHATGLLPDAVFWKKVLLSYERKTKNKQRRKQRNANNRYRGDAGRHV